MESLPSRKGAGVVKCAWCGKNVAVSVKWERPGDGRVFAIVKNAHLCAIDAQPKRDADGGIQFDDF